MHSFLKTSASSRLSDVAASASRDDDERTNDMASRRLVLCAPPTLQVLVRSHDTSSCHSVILEANCEMTIALKHNLHEQTRSIPPNISLISQRFDAELQINTRDQAFLPPG